MSMLLGLRGRKIGRGRGSIKLVELGGRMLLVYKDMRVVGGNRA